MQTVQNLLQSINFCKTDFVMYSHVTNFPKNKKLIENFAKR